MEEKSVLICCPVRDRAWILPYYLKHIYELDYPKKLISILWVLNQSTDESDKILREFKNKHENEYKNITIEIYDGSKKVPRDERINDIRLNYMYSHLSEMRNHILSKVANHDYLFSCDSDIMVRSDCLRKLVDHNKGIVSSLIYNGYLFAGKENAWRYPNILKLMADGTIQHIANTYVKNAPNATESKLLKVDITGAVYLISKKVAEEVKYSWHMQGEDIGFCLDAKSKGFEVWCDVGIFNRHTMSKDMLSDFQKEVF